MGADADGRPELLPQLRLDELLAELQSRLQAVLSARDQMRGLLEAVIAISSGLDLESTLRRIVETGVRLVDATYGALGVIGDGNEGGKRLAEFIPVGLSEQEIERIDHWPEGRGLLGLLIQDPAAVAARRHRHASRSRPGSPPAIPPCAVSSAFPSGCGTRCSATSTSPNKRGGGEFTEDDEAILIALGAAAGVAVENARLYQAARRSQRWIAGKRRGHHGTPVRRGVLARCSRASPPRRVSCRTPISRCSRCLTRRGTC